MDLHRPCADPTPEGYAISSNTTSDLIGAQRSMVDSIAYTFSSPVSLTASDFTLGTVTPTVTGPESPATVVPGLVLTSLNGGTTWVVTWVSGGGTGGTVTGHSIADGVYTITLANSNRSTDTFYRLYGNDTGFQTTPPPLRGAHVNLRQLQRF